MIHLAPVAALLALLPGQDGNLLTTNMAIALRIRAGNNVGTGVVVRANPLTVATCFHVVQRQNTIYIEVPWWNQRFRVDAIAAYPRNDLAFLRVANQALEHFQQWTAPALVMGAPLAALGFGHLKGELLTPVTNFLVGTPRISISTLAGKFGVDVRSDFLVVDMINAKLRRGDSGGPILNAHGDLVGVAAGRLQLPDADDSSQFAIVPLLQLPADGDFGMPSEKTDAEGAYLSSTGLQPALLQVALRLDVALPPDVSAAKPPVPLPAGGSAALIKATMSRGENTDAGTASDAGTGIAADCLSRVTEALDAVAPVPPAALNGASPDCQARYAEIRKLEIALRQEHQAVMALRRLAAQTAAVEKKAQDTYYVELKNAVEAAKVKDKKVAKTYRPVCWQLHKAALSEHGIQSLGTCDVTAFSSARAETWSHVLADDELSAKVAAELAEHGDLMNDRRFTSALRLPPPDLLKPVRIEPGDVHNAALVELGKTWKLSFAYVQSATGREEPQSEVEVTKRVVANALHPDKKYSSESLAAAADKRATALDILARDRNEILGKLSGLQ